MTTMTQGCFGDCRTRHELAGINMVDTERRRDEHEGFLLRLGSPTGNQHSGRRCWHRTLERVRVSGGIAPSGRERRKTSSKTVTIPLLMNVTLLIVVKVIRGLQMFGTIMTSSFLVLLCWWQRVQSATPKREVGRPFAGSTEWLGAWRVWG